MYKVNSKANCNYFNQISFLVFFCKFKLMKMKLSVGKLRLFIIFEFFFENTKMKTTKCNEMQKHKMFFFTFSNSSKTIIHLNANS